MEEKLTTVATYRQSVLAHAAKNFLAEHDIRAFVADEYTADQSWSNFIGAKVQVSARDAERAAALLESVKQV
jgi:Putative prokaryotic signal transducing protein